MRGQLQMVQELAESISPHKHGRGPWPRIQTGRTVGGGTTSTYGGASVQNSRAWTGLSQKQDELALMRRRMIELQSIGAELSKRAHNSPSRDLSTFSDHGGELARLRGECESLRHSHKQEAANSQSLQGRCDDLATTVRELRASPPVQQKRRAKAPEESESESVASESDEDENPMMRSAPSRKLGAKVAALASAEALPFCHP
jgi:chromosome segregation ATPase